MSFDMKKSQPPVHQIELRIVQLSELFNSMNPTPFHHRDLDPNAEKRWRPLQIFLYGWWPIVRKGRIYRNLGRASVHMLPAKA